MNPTPTPPRRRGPATLRLAPLLVLASALWAAPAPAQDIARGQTLYETRCGACHERSVHQRTSRRATDFATLRAQVQRWSATAGGEWKTEEIDQVTAYLNERYYRFPCPPTICRTPARATRSMPGLT